MPNRDPLSIAGQIVAAKYQIEHAVGEGDVAVVYRAMDTSTNVPVAIKLFSGLGSIVAERHDEVQTAFSVHGKLLQELSSETAVMVQARDVGTHTTADERWMPYLVLEWLEGQSLEAVLSNEAAAGRASWSLAEVLRLLGPVAAALEFAHGKGIAHCDIAPSNIFVGSGDPRRDDVNVKVLNFGLAKLITEITRVRVGLAKSSSVVSAFTPQYGAPEQFAHGHGDTGPWTDVFALALVAVEMLAGKAALEGDDPIQLAVCAGNPNERPTPRSLGASVPASVEAVFAKALSVQPSARYPSASALWTALEAALRSSERTGATVTGTVEMTPGSMAFVAAQSKKVNVHFDTSGPASMAPKNKPRTALVGSVAAAALALAGAGFFLSRGRAPTPGSAPVVPPAKTAPSTSPKSIAVVQGKTCPRDMFMIPAGRVTLGSDAKDAPVNQRPSHEVTVKELCFDAYEVTAAAYARCSNDGLCSRIRPEVGYERMSAAEKAAFEPLCNIDVKERSDHPMNCVAWKDADTHCRANGKRLPTEAEWEHATRGPDGRIYPWGNEAPTVEHLNACDTECARWGKGAGAGVVVLFATASDGYAATSPVGRFPKGRSRFGPWDVVGNVSEWVSDWDGPDGADARKNPTGSTSGRRKVVRGSAWISGTEGVVRAAHRFSAEPERRHPGIGFRCATDL